MTAAKIVGLLSAISGAVGTLLLYRSSFAYEQASFFGSEKIWEEMRKRNKKRQQFQRAGLGLLMMSFILAGFSVML